LSPCICPKSRERWAQTVKKFNYFADGIINYRIGSGSKLAKTFGVRDDPAFMMINLSGELIKTDVRRPSDPALKQALDQMATVNRIN
jgi:hypothetical protein